jgi:hypothetical protein
MAALQGSDVPNVFEILLTLLVTGISLVPAYLVYRTGRATGDDDAVLWAAVAAAVTVLGLTSGSSGVSFVLDVVVSLVPGIGVLVAYIYVRQYRRS